MAFDPQLVGKHIRGDDVEGFAELYHRQDDKPRYQAYMLGVLSGSALLGGARNILEWMFDRDEHVPVNTGCFFMVHDEPSAHSLSCLDLVLEHTRTYHEFNEILELTKDKSFYRTILARVARHADIRSLFKILEQQTSLEDTRLIVGTANPATLVAAVVCVLGTPVSRVHILLACIPETPIRARYAHETPNLRHILHAQMSDMSRFYLARAPGYPLPIWMAVRTLYLVHLRSRGAPGEEAEPGTLGTLPPEMVWTIARFVCTAHGWVDVIAAEYS